MVDTARALLDELMGRNRDLDPSVKVKKFNWDDPEFCQYYLVKFCPHDLFVNTRADLGPCPKLHDDEAKRMYETARPGARKKQYEDDFLRFCNNMINEVDRKIQKGRQRLLLMNKGEGGPVYISKFQEQLNNLNARIKKLLNEAEEAGHRGDVDQAQGLMTLCEQLKEEKEALLSQHDSGTGATTSTTATIAAAITTTSAALAGPAGANISGGTTISTNNSNATGIPSWASDLNSAQEKQMEVCEVCGAFLIVGDVQQRIEDHLTGKQHLGYSRLRKAVEEMHEKRQKEREEEERRREEERKAKLENGMDRRRDRDRGDRDRRHRNEFDDRKRRGYSRDFDRRDKDKFRDREFRSTEPDKRDREREKRNNRRESENRRRSRSRSRSRR